MTSGKKKKKKENLKKTTWFLLLKEIFFLLCWHFDFLNSLRLNSGHVLEKRQNLRFFISPLVPDLYTCAPLIIISGTLFSCKPTFHQPVFDQRETEQPLFSTSHLMCLGLVKYNLVFFYFFFQMLLFHQIFLGCQSQVRR